MTPADAGYLEAMREKIGRYPALAREAMRRGDRDKANEYWRLWHEAIDELLAHFGAAPGNVD